MLPPLDRKWTWEAWAAAQTVADPWKKPYTKDEITKIVHRAEIAGIPPYKMEEALQVPFPVIKQMLRSPRPSDPYRQEMAERSGYLRIEAELARMQDLPFPERLSKEYERARQMVRDTASQLWHVTELADPEVVAQMRQRMEAK